MIKKTLATAAIAASAVGAVGIAASPAMAIGGDAGHETVNGNGSAKLYGNTTTGGTMSPNMALVNGSLNDLCIPALPNTTAQSILGLVNVGLDDILSSQQQQYCNDNSTQIDGDDPLSKLLSDLSLLSENGVSEH
ncbi:rodlin [Streptomyces radicis]|uniref:RdlA protein n=1 Tax=Streptomyces radicis TaxID=1750517 RepID=A0A3A9W623_9ACTN|nr:rodlin [Streptomyces radicis]RKN08651.1 RdlA protein [Streptomyces radicis]RKN21809.1 RdlA protein [Streptomyces radicis]